MGKLKSKLNNALHNNKV